MLNDFIVLVSIGLTVLAMVFYFVSAYLAYREKESIGQNLGRYPSLIVLFFILLGLNMGWRIFVITCRHSGYCEQGDFRTESILLNSIFYTAIAIIPLLWWLSPKIYVRKEK